MDDVLKQSIGAALGAIPSGLFVLAAQHEEQRCGMLVSWVQQVCFEPPMLVVAIAKGRSIMPLISESRQFSLCQLADDDKMMSRKFASGCDLDDDPFLGFDLIQGQLNNLPILSQCLSYLECELSCHMDVEGDHDLFIGRVCGGARHAGTPRVHLRKNGFNY